MQHPAIDSLTQASHWHTGDHFRRLLTPTMRYWLLSKGSLTAQLEAEFGPIRLAEVSEQHAYANRQQAQGLNIAHRSAIIVRNIRIDAANAPLIWAHSVLPLTSLAGANQQIRLQRHKPLGKILFQHRSLCRSPIHIAHVGNYWCRRSVFTLNHHPIMVAEAFAPELLG